MRVRFPVLLALVMAGASPTRAAENAWSAIRTPTPGPAQAIGSYANGCISGAQALEPEGTGYQVIRLHRNRYWGHPELIAFLRDFGRRVAKTKLGIALVGDLGQPRGGPMSYGHASHQIGLDVDIWLRLDLPRLPRDERADLEEINMVDPQTRRIDPRRWTAKQAALIRLAAADPRVVRIFVNPGIKLALCESRWSGRDWLRKVRPWGGHDGHFHVRLQCPPGSPGCAPQPAPPPGDGCGADLAAWFAPPKAAPAPTAPRVPPPLPAACQSLLRVGPLGF